MLTNVPQSSEDAVSGPAGPPEAIIRVDRDRGRRSGRVPGVPGLFVLHDTCIGLQPLPRHTSCRAWESAKCLLRAFH